MSYHIQKIPKGSIGEVSKITEEYFEFMDSIKQKSDIMGLVELSDLLGAIEEYLKKFNITLNDLIIMSNITKRVFKTGYRK